MRALTILAIALVACATPREPAPTVPGGTEARYLAVNGGRIYYEVAGQGPAIVLIHGGFGDRRMWDPQFSLLARNYRVVRYDHRGFGNSSAPDSAYTATDDMVKLLDHLGIAKATVIGNSVGGGVALDFAIAHPQRVNKVVVVASGANGYPFKPEDWATMRTAFEVAEESGVDSAAALWLKDPMIAVASRSPRSAALVRQMVLDNKNIFRMQNWPWGTLKPPAYERLGDVKVPVLLIVGDQDIAPVQRVAAATAAGVQNGKLIVMEGADHLPQLADPDAFNRHLTAFLKQ
jgi:3-oxoadipate enol-lactonase